MGDSDLTGADVSVQPVAKDPISKQVQIGIGVGLACMLLVTALVFAVLVVRDSVKKQRRQRDSRRRRHTNEEPAILGDIAHTSLARGISERNSTVFSTAYNKHSFATYLAGPAPGFADSYDSGYQSSVFNANQRRNNLPPGSRGHTSVHGNTTQVKGGWHWTEKSITSSPSRVATANPGQQLRPSSPATVQPHYGSERNSQPDYDELRDPHSTHGLYDKHTKNPLFEQDRPRLWLPRVQKISGSTSNLTTPTGQEYELADRAQSRKAKSDIQLPTRHRGPNSLPDYSPGYHRNAVGMATAQKRLNYPPEEDVWVPRTTPAAMRQSSSSVMGYNTMNSDVSSCSSGSDRRFRDSIPSFVSAEYERVVEPINSSHMNRMPKHLEHRQMPTYPLPEMPDSGFFEGVNLHRQTSIDR